MSNNIQAVIFSFDNTLVSSLDGLITSCAVTLDKFCDLAGISRDDVIDELKALANEDDWDTWHERKQEEFDNVLRNHCPSIVKALEAADENLRADLESVLDGWDAMRRSQMSLYKDHKTDLDMQDILHSLKSSGRKIAIHTDVPLPCTIRLLIENNIRPEDIDLIAAVQYQEVGAERDEFMKLSDEEKRYFVQLMNGGKVLPITDGSRKPSPATTLKITQRLGVSPDNTLMIGEKHVDWGTTKLKGVFNENVKIAPASPGYIGPEPLFGWAAYGTELSDALQQFYDEIFSGDKRPVGQDHIAEKFEEWGIEPDMTFKTPTQILSKLNIPLPQKQGPVQIKRRQGPGPS